MPLPECGIPPLALFDTAAAATALDEPAIIMWETTQLALLDTVAAAAVLDELVPGGGEIPPLELLDTVAAAAVLDEPVPRGGEVVAERLGWVPVEYPDRPAKGAVGAE